VDVSDPGNPVLIANGEAIGYLYDIAVYGDYAYVVTLLGTLNIFDISNPADPVETAIVALPSMVGMAVAVAYPYVYVANSYAGLIIYDCSDPENPVEIAAFVSRGSVQDVHYSDGYIYIADGDAGLSITDVTDPFNPFITGYYDTDGASVGVCVVGIHAFIADDQSLVICDCDEATSMSEAPPEAYQPDYLDISVYPNPFNPVTAISFQLPVLSQVNLSVHDVTGAKVATLIEGERVPGVYEVTFDGRDLVSGIYFARLTAGELTQTQKLVLLK